MFEKDPANERIADAAEMGYDYQPDFDDNKESSEAREIAKRGEIKDLSIFIIFTLNKFCIYVDIKLL